MPDRRTVCQADSPLSGNAAIPFAPSAPPVVRAIELTRVYRRGSEAVRALDGVSLEVPAGTFGAVIGPSGAGKSTLLHMLGCMDAPTSGRLWLDGEPVEGMGEAARTRMRRERIGFVFQQFGLVPTLTVAENVALPTLFGRRAVRERVTELLDRVGLAHRRNHRPQQLSGGEMQRVAIARSLVNRPRFLLADEPTGNLDSAAGEAVLDLFRQLHREGLTVIVVTHNPALAAAAERQWVLRDGRLVE
jgi:putative ABC transport system ATP-binding protein